MDGRLKSYTNYRPYTDEEIQDEQDEYFENDTTKTAVPGLFKDHDDITAWIKDSQLELLDIDELNQLGNSDVPEILSIDSKRGKLDTAVKYMKHYGKDYFSLLSAFKNNHKLPPPLVIRDKNNSLHLMAGNSRMMVATALGYNMPVKVVRYTQEIVTEAYKMNTDSMINIAKELIKLHKLKSKVKIEKSNNKADYEWVTDTITINPKQDSLIDYVKSVLHEIDHARMRKKYGADGYEQAYTVSGQMMVDKGKDFYWDNPFERQARKYEKTATKWIKKIAFLIPS